MDLHAFTLQPTPDDRSTEFKPLADTGESFNGYTLMVEAYAAIWVILFAWIFFLWRKQATLNARVQGLEEALDRAEKKSAASTKA
jgi:CcmD family protein